MKIKKCWNCCRWFAEPDVSMLGSLVSISGSRWCLHRPVLSDEPKTKKQPILSRPDVSLEALMCLVVCLSVDLSAANLSYIIQIFLAHIWICVQGPRLHSVIHLFYIIVDCSVLYFHWMLTQSWPNFGILKVDSVMNSNIYRYDSLFRSPQHFITTCKRHFQQSPKERARFF